MITFIKQFIKTGSCSPGQCPVVLTAQKYYCEIEHRFFTNVCCCSVKFLETFHDRENLTWAQRMSKSLLSLVIRRLFFTPEQNNLPNISQMIQPDAVIFNYFS